MSRLHYTATLPTQVEEDAMTGEGEDEQQDEAKDSGSKTQDYLGTVASNDSGLGTCQPTMGIHQSVDFSHSDSVETDASPISPGGAFAPTTPGNVPSKIANSLMPTKESFSDIDKEKERHRDLHRLDSGVSSLSLEDSVDEKDLPLKFRIPQFDALLLYDDKDKTQALGLKEVLETDDELWLKDSTHIKICTPDDECFSEIQSEIARIDIAVESSTYILMYMSENFVGDKWTELQRDEIIMTSVMQADKNWCVVPLWQVPKRKLSFTIPFGLRSLRGIHVGSMDKYFYRNVLGLFNVKLHMKEKRSVKLEGEKQIEIEKLKAKKQREKEHLESERVNAQRKLDNERQRFLEKQREAEREADHQKQLEQTEMELQLSKQAQIHMQQIEMVNQQKEREYNWHRKTMQKIQSGEVTMPYPPQQHFPPSEQFNQPFPRGPFNPNYHWDQVYYGPFPYAQPPAGRMQWPVHYQGPNMSPYTGPQGYMDFNQSQQVPQYSHSHQDHSHSPGNRQVPLETQYSTVSITTPGQQGYMDFNQSQQVPQYSHSHQDHSHSPGNRQVPLETQYSTVSIPTPGQHGQFERHEIRNSPLSPENPNSVGTVTLQTDKTLGNQAQRGQSYLQDTNEGQGIGLSDNSVSLMCDRMYPDCTRRSNAMQSSDYDVVTDGSLDLTSPTASNTGCVEASGQSSLTFTRSNREPEEQEDDSMLESALNEEDILDLPIYKVVKPPSEYQPTVLESRQRASAQSKSIDKGNVILGNQGEGEICGFVTGSPNLEVKGHDADGNSHATSSKGRNEKGCHGAQRKPNKKHTRKVHSSSEDEGSDDETVSKTYRNAKVVKEVHHHYYGQVPDNSSQGDKKQEQEFPKPATPPKSPPAQPHHTTQIINIYNSSGVQIGNQNKAVIGQTTEVMPDEPDSPVPVPQPQTPPPIADLPGPPGRSEGNSSPANSSGTGHSGYDSDSPRVNFCSSGDQMHSVLSIDQTGESVEDFQSVENRMAAPSFHTMHANGKILPIAVVGPQQVHSTNTDSSETFQKTPHDTESNQPTHCQSAHDTNRGLQDEYDQTDPKFMLRSKNTESQQNASVAMIKSLDGSHGAPTMEMGEDSCPIASQHNEMLAAVPPNLHVTCDSRTAGGLDLTYYSNNMDDIYPSSTDNSITNLKRLPQDDDMEIHVPAAHGIGDKDEFVSVHTEPAALPYSNIAHPEDPASYVDTEASVMQPQEEYEARSTESGIGISFGVKSRAEGSEVKPTLAVVAPPDTSSNFQNYLEGNLQETSHELTYGESQVVSPRSSGLGRSLSAENRSAGPEHQMQSHLPQSKLTEPLLSFSTEPAAQALPVGEINWNDNLEKDNIDSEDGSESSGEKNAKKRCLIM